MKNLQHISILIIVALLCSCRSPQLDQIDLMPAPHLFAEGLYNPLPQNRPFEEIPYGGLLYATDRAPATAKDKEPYYLNDRGSLLRVGVARVQLGETDIDWQKAREISLLKSRPGNYPVKVQGVDEWGLLASTVPFWVDLSLVPETDRVNDATQKFADAINAQLARSIKKHVYIYVHGYKVAFENPLLVSTELWHFLGYDGVFIAYAWPSTPSKFAYIKDSETSDGYARNFRLLIESIAENTDVEQIQILGYSNGTRLVTRAMEQLALARQQKSAEENYRELRIGNVLLVGSDLDRGVFGSYVADGLLNVARHLTIYMSQHDKALGFSQFLTRRQRLGQLWGSGIHELTPQARHALKKYQDRISYINVSDAEGSATGNGHGYFRSSPLASSDVLATLYYGMTPEQRGLIEQEDLPIYTFPADYISRLWSGIGEVDPTFEDAYEQLKAQRAKASE
jgi:esterase/lipase superfamily enzyme